MSDLYILGGILLFMGLAIWYISNLKVSKEKFKNLKKATKIQENVNEAVAEKELEHKKDLSAASDFERACRMWNDKPPKT